MCYDTTKWEDARDAIIKSAFATPKFCLNKSDLDDDKIKHFEIPDIPEFLTHP